MWFEPYSVTPAKKNLIGGMLMAKRNEEIEKIIDGYTLFDDELMSTVFDENIEATEYLLKTILGRDDIRVISAKGEYSVTGKYFSINFGR